jgi:hypothetical protein
MVPNMEAIVGAVDHIGVVNLAALFEAGYEFVDQLVDALQGAEALAVEEVFVVDNALVLKS